MDAESFVPRNVVVRGRTCRLDGGVPPTTGGGDMDIIPDGRAIRWNGKVRASERCMYECENWKKDDVRYSTIPSSAKTYPLILKLNMTAQ
jgi:hypothetical protein